MINLAQDLKPISYVKSHIAEIVNYVGSTKSPVVITQNGEAKAVIIDIESYQKTISAVNLVQDLKPISYVKAHTTEVVNYVGKSKSTVVITQNGEAKAVIIDIESYQKTINAINLAKLLSFGEKDIKNGSTITHANAKKIFEKTLETKNQ